LFSCKSDWLLEILDAALPTAPVNLASGHPINVQLYFNQGVSAGPNSSAWSCAKRLRLLVVVRKGREFIPALFILLPEFMRDVQCRGTVSNIQDTDDAAENLICST